MFLIMLPVILRFCLFSLFMYFGCWVSQHSSRVLKMLNFSPFSGILDFGFLISSPGFPKFSLFNSFRNFRCWLSHRSSWISKMQYFSPFQGFWVLGSSSLFPGFQDFDLFSFCGILGGGFLISLLGFLESEIFNF